MDGPNSLTHAIKCFQQHASTGPGPLKRSHSTVDLLMFVYQQILPINKGRIRIQEPRMIGTNRMFYREYFAKMLTPVVMDHPQLRAHPVPGWI